MQNNSNRLLSALDKFRIVFDYNSDALIIFDLDNFNVREVNQAACDMFGYSKDEFYNLAATDLVLYPLITKARMELMVAKAEDHYEITRTITRKNGETIQVIAHLNFVKEFRVIVASLVDVTEKSLYEEKLKKLQAAVEQSQNIIIITNIQGEIEYVNKRFTEITGYKKSEVVGKKPSILKSEKHDEFFYKQLWETILQGKVWKNEMINKKKNGQYYWESVTITPIRDNTGQLTNFIAIKEDITEAKLAEKKLFEAIVETEEREKKSFAEDLHDELGPFLSSIKLFINEFKYDDMTSERRNELVEYLNQLINEAIENTRSISNKLMPGVLADYGLQKALNSFISKLNITNSIQINCHCFDNDNRFDPTIEIVIYRVIIELINNSIKHAECDQINIYIDNTDDEIEITYEDNGKGLSPDVKVTEGMGLKNIVNRIRSLNGSFYFINNPGKGFRFTFNISFEKNF